MPKRKVENKKPNKRKIGLIVTVVLLLACIVVISVFFLIGQTSQEKRDYEAQIKHEMQELTDTLIADLEKIDPSEGINEEAEAGNIPATEVPAEVITEAERQIIDSELSKLDDVRKQKVLQVLSVVYSKALNEQKLKAFTMADELITQAKRDWSSTEGMNEEETALYRGRLITEYMAKSSVMEEQMDASFDTLVSKMEEQLAAEGIDPTAIINQYKAEYKKIKEENRKALMSKAMEAV